MPELFTIYDYMRSYSGLLGKRILQQFPALHQVGDPLSGRMNELLRKPFPAQAISIMGLAKRWHKARTGMVVPECGTGKTLISLGAIHVHSEGKPFTALAMVPPQLALRSENGPAWSQVRRGLNSPTKPSITLPSNSSSCQHASIFIILIRPRNIVG